MRYIALLLLVITFSRVYSQVDANVTVFNPNKDSSSLENEYYTDLTDKLLIKFTNSYKYTKLDITNVNDNQTLKLSPAGNVDLGLAVNYKWFGLGLSLGLPSGSHSDSTKGKTSRFDLQFNIYSKRFVVDALYQKYKGFHVANKQDFIANDSNSTNILPQLPNMENYSLGVAGYYIFNYKKFSYRAAYVRNEIQNKSAGSILAGPFLNIDAATTPNGFVPNELPIEVKDTFNIKSFSSISYGIAVGYTYSFVIVKKVFVNLSLVPGIGIKDLKVNQNGTNRVSKQGVAARITYRVALGYEHKSFLLGLSVYGTQGSIKIDNLEIKPGAGLISLFVAKRFDFSKKK